MGTIKLNNADVLGAVSAADIESLQHAAEAAVEKLEKGTGEGNDFLGWLHLPSTTSDALLDEVEAAAAQLRNSC